MKSSDEGAAHFDLNEFNWGAFWLTWIWAVGNRCMNWLSFALLIAVFLPYIGVFAAVALAVYSGRTGNRRAWAVRRQKDETAFLANQRRWKWAANALVGTLVALLIVAVMFGGR
jgi:hypothetical protein